ncbi:MAG: DUF1801 domain-containing protein [Chloroflexi bacterium]|nr:MAG: DUF1801 domain-containing protein [Chloroflexota bacterium]TME45408.1 MAG: DUF1801 domain-containing protein [Chloroflexota bacterium]
MPAAKKPSAKADPRAGERAVDAYIAAAPKTVQPILRELRRLIKAAAPPDTQERISYKIPYYDYHGRLTYFAVFKDHISFFVPGAATAKFASELQKYRTRHRSEATIILPLDQRLPATLITKLVKARAKELSP